MNAAARLLAEAMQRPENEREDLAAKLLDSLEPAPGSSSENKDEIEARAAEARSGVVPGIRSDAGLPATENTMGGQVVR